jgi:hypothetical protein
LTPDSQPNSTRGVTSVWSACLLHCLHTGVPKTVPAFANCLLSLLLTAAVCQSGCKPVSDDLFLVDSTSIAQAGTVASSSAAGSGSEPAAMPPTPSAGSTASVQPSGPRPARNETVKFEWSESIPGAGVCQATMFTGLFECQVGTIVGRPDVLYGVVNLRLMGTSEAQNLNISGGSITVWDAMMTRVVIAPLSGALQCGTQSFTADIDPTPSDPMPLERQIAWFNPVAQPVTTGTLRGSLDPDLQEIEGDIEIRFDPNARCQGDFSIKGSTQ